MRVASASEHNPYGIGEGDRFGLRVGDGAGELPHQTANVVGRGPALQIRSNTMRQRAGELVVRQVGAQAEPALKIGAKHVPSSR